MTECSEIAKTLIKLADGELGTNLADQLALAFTEAKLDPPQSLKLNTSDETEDAARMDGPTQRAAATSIRPPAAESSSIPTAPAASSVTSSMAEAAESVPTCRERSATINRVQLIQSILEPSREIAPQFVSWTFELKDGKVVNGMIVHENEGKTIVGNAEGQLIEIKTANIESRTPQKISVMPEKLADRMTLQELRDVIAFLDSQR